MLGVAHASDARSRAQAIPTRVNFEKVSVPQIRSHRAKGALLQAVAVMELGHRFESYFCIAKNRVPRKEEFPHPTLPVRWDNPSGEWRTVGLRLLRWSISAL